jgi:uncharacterized membrane protein YfcA
MKPSKAHQVLPVFVSGAAIGIMAAGSLAGAFLGARLLGLVPAEVLLPLPATILVISAVKLWRHD